MESFAAVVRSLLVRIRAFQASRSGAAGRRPNRNDPWPPPAVAGDGASHYRVTPTAWGVAQAASEPTAGTPAKRSAPPARNRRRSLELTVYGLPVPRGLPAT